METSTPPLRVGVFRGLARADRAVEELTRNGFPAERISVICPECAPDAFSDDVERVSPAGAHTRKALIEGGAIGALLGGLTAGVGLIATGGIGLFVAGPLLVSGAVAGSFVGAMTTRGFEPEIADFYDQALTKGNVLVAVDTAPGDRIPSPEHAEHVFEECGAEPISLRKG